MPLNFLQVDTRATHDNVIVLARMAVAAHRRDDDDSGKWLFEAQAVFWDLRRRRQTKAMQAVIARL